MARLFNGSTDKIDADAAHLTNAGIAFSISFWVKSSIANANAKNVYSEANSGAAGPFFQTQGDASGHIVWAARSATSGSSDLKATTATPFDGSWHHVCITQDASNNIRTYVDGVLDNTTARTALSNTAGQTFNTTSIGYFHRNTTAQFYGGTVAEVATWGRQLALGEIQHLAAGGQTEALGPTHYWPLWGIDSPEPDLGTG